jgi:itaconate CoA-transferase
MIVPYRVYACADGGVNFAIQNDREWQRFSSVVLSMPALINDERFITNEVRVRHRVELENIIEQYLRTLKRSEVLGRLEEAQIAHGEMNDVAGVVQHPQLAARHRGVQVDSPSGTIPALVPPHNLQNAPARMLGVPALGEHSQEILAELGLRRME